MDEKLLNKSKRLIKWSIRWKGFEKTYNMLVCDASIDMSEKARRTYYFWDIVKQDRKLFKVPLPNLFVLGKWPEDAIHEELIEYGFSKKNPFVMLLNRISDNRKNLALDEIHPDAWRTLHNKVASGSFELSAFSIDDHTFLSNPRTYLTRQAFERSCSENGI